MKVRNAEKDVQRFKDCWLMESKDDDLPAQKEQLTNGNFFFKVTSDQYLATFHQSGGGQWWIFTGP